MALVSMDVKGDGDDVAPAGYDACPGIYLNDDQVEALGIKGMPAPGTVFTLQCRAVVTRVSAEGEEADEVAAEGNAPDVSLSLKITDMAATRSEAAPGSVLYGE